MLITTTTMVITMVVVMRHVLIYRKKNFKQQNLPNYNEEYCITVSYSKATNIQILKVYG